MFPDKTLPVTVDGKAQPSVIIQGSQLYPTYVGTGSEHLLRVTAPKAGLSAYTFTFGWAFFLRSQASFASAIYSHDGTTCFLDEVHDFIWMRCHRGMARWQCDCLSRLDSLRHEFFSLRRN